MATKPIFPDVDPWPEQRSVAPPPRDHNKPPLEELIPVEFREALLSDRADFLDKLDHLLGTEESEGAVDRAFCSDDESLAKCGSLINTLRACEKHVDATHRAVKEPYLLGGKLVDGQKNTLVARIIAGRQKVEALQQRYVQERQRIAAEQRAKEEAERRRLEELARENNLSAALPAAPEPEKPRGPLVRSDDGATVSTSIVLVSKVTDYTKAFRHVKADAKVREAIDAAIQRMVKATKATELAGVEIREETVINNR